MIRILAVLNICQTFVKQLNVFDMYKYHISIQAQLANNLKRVINGV